MSTGPPLSFHVVKNSSSCDTAGTLVPDTHGDLCLSFPVGDILSESAGNLPILQQGTAEEKKYFERFSALLGGKAKMHKFSSCQEHAHKLPVVTH